MFSFHSKYFVYRQLKRARQKLSFCFKCPDTGTVRILGNILYWHNCFHLPNNYYVCQIWLQLQSVTVYCCFRRWGLERYTSSRRVSDAYFPPSISLADFKTQINITLLLFSEFYGIPFMSYLVETHYFSGNNSLAWVT